jgi:hypothetical protein
MADFPATVLVDGQKFAIQAPNPSENGESYQVIDPSGESLGAIEVAGREVKRAADPTLQRVADAALAAGIFKPGAAS